MKLISMEMSKEEMGEYAKPETALAEAPKYPYGLRISLDEEALKKLGLPALPAVGQKMSLDAAVEVCSISEYDSTGEGKKRSMDLQITAMMLGPAGEEETESASEKLYG